MAQSSEERNALRRLERFLSDPDKYEQFRQLPKREQNRLLDLVEQNDSRQARRLLGELDERRRHQRTLRDRVRRYARRPQTQRIGSNRPMDWVDEQWRLYDEMMGV